MNIHSFDSISAPFWSVMIPTYNPPRHYLEAALSSVINQGFSAEEMQIEVVDDCSPNGAPFEIVGNTGGRVGLHENTRNLGLAGTWNECIRRARGQWIHILHQDDLVRPGFYEKLQRGIRSRPSVGAAFCRHAFIDHHGTETGRSDAEAEAPGILRAFDLKTARAITMQFASVVVKRATYDEVGLFDSRFRYVLDWDMWLRIARAKPVWYEPDILACYRLHGSTATSRLQRRAADIKDIRLFLNHARAYFQKRDGLQALASARCIYALRAVGIANNFLREGDLAAGLRQLFGAWSLYPSTALLRGTARFALNLVTREHIV